MFGNVTLESVIAFTRLSVALTCCWPLRSTATKSQVIRFKIFRFTMILNAFVLFLPLLNALYVQRDNASNFAQAACLALAVVQLLMQTAFCITQYDRLQVRLYRYNGASFNVNKSRVSIIDTPNKDREF